MPKSKNRRRGKSKKKPPIIKKNYSKTHISKDPNVDIFIAEHPFNGLPPDKIKDALIEVGKKAQKEYPILKKKLELLLNRYDPLHVLSVIASYTMFGGLDENHEVTGGISSSGLEQAHIELSQAIFLRQSLNIDQREICRPHDFQEIFTLLKEFGETSTMSRFVQIEQTQDDEEKGYLQLAERLRLHTQFVRNWGHYQDVISLLSEIYTPLDKIYTENIGLSSSNIIELFVFMMQSIEDRWNAILTSLKYIFSGSTRRKKINRYLETFPELEQEPEKFFAFIKKHSISDIHLRSLILSHMELRYSHVFTFSDQELASYLNIEANQIREGLSKLSLSFGDLANNEFDHLFLGNPVWEKPLINLDGYKFYCLLPQLFFGFSHHIFENLLVPHPAARKKVETRRAEFLEEKVEQLFQAAFPDAEIIPGMKWNLNGRQYETDLLVKVDSHLIIIEAKSGKVPWVALRGGVKSAKARIKKLIADPAQQACRLEEALISLQEGKNTDLKIGLPFDLGGIHRIIKLAVTLEDFATIQSNTAELIRIGVMSEDTPLVATMNIADLKVVLELLDSEAERIHYLDRRNEIQNSVRYIGDEMDLLAFYLKKGFVFGEFESGNTMLNLLGLSQPIDDYYQSIQNGGSPIKPKRIMTEWYGDICSFLSERKIPCWTEMAIIVLGVDYKDQQKMEMEYNKICRVLKKTGEPKEDQINTMMHIPIEGGKYGIAFVAFFEEERKNRHNIMSNAAGHVFEQSSVEKCLVLARDLEGKDYPYTTLVVATP